MSLEQVGSLGYGGERLNTRLPKIIAELQGFTVSGPLTGAGAGVPIVVPEGISTGDTILKNLMFTAGVPSDVTAATSVVDIRSSGTLTLAAVVAGDTAVVRGKTYTAVAFTPNPSNGAVGPMNFAVGTTDTITAANLAAAISVADPLVLATSAAAIVTVRARAEGTASNAYTLVGGAHITASAATLTGGSFGVQFGTVTAATVVAGNTVTIGGQVFTAVASTGGAPVGAKQFIFSPAVADLIEIGLSQGDATALAATPNPATAFYLAHQVNAAMGATLTAAAAAAVITLTADYDTALPVITLVSSGATLAVSGAGTLTAGGREIVVSSATTGNTLVLMWYKKSRNLGVA